MMSVFHGSDVEKIEREYGISAGDIVSFSANVSPMGVSGKYLKEIGDRLHCVERYPERDYRSLKNVISGYCGAETSHIIVGNGSSELIGGVIRHKDSPRVLIAAPAYSEYERNVELAGGSSDYFYLKEEDGFEFDIKALNAALKPDYDMLVLCNPVNPTSTAAEAGDLREVLEKCEEYGIICVVDETYIDFADAKYDATPLADEYKSLFVIRSMSKFFCAPGLRLGYGITSNEELMDEIKQRVDPWSVSSLSAEASAIMLSDSEYIESSRKYMHSERSRVCEALDALAGYGIRYYEPQANFVLLKLPEGEVTSHSLFEMAIHKGLMIRDCSDFEGLDDSYIRFCFMKSEDDDRLLRVIKEAYT